MNIKNSLKTNYLRYGYSKLLIAFCFFIISLKFSQSHAQSTLGDSFLNKANSFQNTNHSNGDSIIFYNQEAAKSYKNNEKNFSGWLKSHLNISVVLQSRRLFAENTLHIDSVFKQAWVQTPTPEENSRLISLNFHQGYNYYFLGDYIKAIKYYRHSRVRIPQNCTEKDKSNNNPTDDCLDYESEGRYILYPLNLSYLEIGDYNAMIDQISDKFLSDWKKNIRKDSEYDHLSRLYSLKGQAYLKRGLSQDTVMASGYLYQAHSLPHLSEIQKSRVGVDYNRVLNYFQKSTEGINILQKTIKSLKATSLKEEAQNEILLSVHLFLSYIYRDQGNYLLATHQADSALKLFLNTSKSSKNKDLAKIYMLKAGLLYQQSYFSESRENYQKALACIITPYQEETPIHKLSKKNIIPDFDLLHLLQYMGDNWKKEYDNGGSQSMDLLDHAIACYRLAIYTEDSLKSHYQFETSRLEISRKRIPYIGSAIDAAYQLWNKTSASNYMNDALFFFEKSQAQELQMALKLNRFINEDSTLKSIYQKKSDTWREKDLLQTEFEQIKYSNNQDSNKLDILSDTISKLEWKYTQLHYKFQSLLQTKYPFGITWLNTIQTIKLSALQKSLHSKEMLISFFESPVDSMLFILYIGSSKTDFKKIPLNKSLYDKINSIKQFLRIKEPSISDQIHYQKVAFELYQSFLAPIHQLSLKKLIVVPSPILHDLPLEVLLTKAPDTLHPVLYRKLDYLWQKFPIRYLEAATLIDQTYPQKIKTPLAYLGFAPDYALASIDGKSASERNQNIILDHNQKEIKNTVKNFSNIDQCGVFISDSAIELTFVDLAPTAEILHLSMHADTQSNDLFSYLQFLEINNLPQEYSDGKLFMHEIYNLQLNADLTILSACETGLGTTLIGEGIMSLGRAFQFAGSSNILMSLWKVDDYSSSELIPIFMKYIQKGYDKDEALHKARMDFMFDQGRHNVALSPYHWAQYILYGDDFPVPSTNRNWIYWGLALIFGLLMVVGGLKLFKRIKGY